MIARIKRKITDDKLDELLYQYMPLAENIWGDIVYIYYQNEKVTVGLDTEGAVIKTKEISGENVEYFENKGMGYVYWTDTDTYYNILGYVEVDELLKMADSVINNEKYNEN